MGGGTLDERLRPRLEPWEFVDDAERLDAVEEEVALQERRVGGIDQRILCAVEQRTGRALFLQRALELAERGRNFFGHRIVGCLVRRIAGRRDRRGEG